VDPFKSLDQDGVGGLIHYAVNQARAVKPDLKLGICGEHGGDAASIEFCYRAGLNYVSCSPYRVPLARLAGAQAVLNSDNAGEEPKAKRGRKPGNAKAVKPAKEAKPAKAASAKAASTRARKPAKQAAPAKPAGAPPEGAKRGRGRPKKS
jgi:pyruvate,orthophosphate dikinase